MVEEVKQKEKTETDQNVSKNPVMNSGCQRKKKKKYAHLKEKRNKKRSKNKNKLIKTIYYPTKNIFPFAKVRHLQFIEREKGVDFIENHEFLKSINHGEIRLDK